MLLLSQNIFIFSTTLEKLKIKIYNTIILPIVLYGYETRSVTLREEHMLRVFENRILRRVFGPERYDNEEWRRIHNELHSLYISHSRLIKFRKLRWDRPCSQNGGR